jgi:hypothetical protein
MESSTGSYAVATVYKIPWNQKKKPTEKEKTRGRKKISEKIINPIFMSCSELTTDSYWKEIFENAARNKFPRSFTFRNGFLTHKKLNKVSQIQITNSVHETLSLCQTFFGQMAGMMSKDDRIRKQKEIELELISRYSLDNLTWTEIKKEKVRNLLINEFIFDIRDRLNLDNDKLSELITTINKGFLLKYLSKSDVIFEQGRILAIHGLIIDEENRTFSLDKSRQLKKSRLVKVSLKVSDESDEKPSDKTKFCFSKAWQKYLKALNKVATKNSIIPKLNVIDSTPSLGQSQNELYIDKSTDDFSN